MSLLAYTEDMKYDLLHIQGKPYVLVPLHAPGRDPALQLAERAAHVQLRLAHVRAPTLHGLEGVALARANALETEDLRVATSEEILGIPITT